MRSAGLIGVASGAQHIAAGCPPRYGSGVEALVQLTLAQRRRDLAAGLRTAGFVSGYRGSPLGGLDEAFERRRSELLAEGVHFQPGINEELAATAVWGTQQVALIGPSTCDGVFAMWYGKGPGVDRCVDVFRHAAHGGCSVNGGVLLVAGDDHGAYSSTLPNQSDQVFAACMVPFLFPSSLSDYLELGLHGWALSRFAGCPVGFKALADTVESSGALVTDPLAVRIRWPGPGKVPAGERHAALSAETLGRQARSQEEALHRRRLPAVLAYARCNRLNRVVFDSPHARRGIVASGKSYADAREALALLGVDEARAAAIGLRLMKVTMPWPLEPEGMAAFASGLESVLVVEEKRPLVESQLREQLFDQPDARRPRVLGKLRPVANDPELELPATADFSVDRLLRVFARFLDGLAPVGEEASARLAALQAAEARRRALPPLESRVPHYCSGCPHSRSTRTPEGSVALGGIGCHIMATSIFPESNRGFTQMGGEGASWIGQAPFSRRGHVFANLGDGTYYHSGILAVRAAVAAGVNITYKILYNDAVAMTGGQKIDGPLDVPALVRQLVAEGVRRIAVVGEQAPPRGGLGTGAATVEWYRPEALDALQRSLRNTPGVSALVHDRSCAAERRRRWRAGSEAPPATRLFINEAVCEGCGDCGQVSRCTSLMPAPTPEGLKRRIDQTSCNVDLACLDGFCPSFVSVLGGRVRRPDPAACAAQAETGPEPEAPAIPNPAGGFDIVVAGIGGSGVVTLAQWLGRAAHREGHGVNVLDMTGMSQKNGAVVSHVRIGRGTAAARIPCAGADLLLGCDLLVAASDDVLHRAAPQHTQGLFDGHRQPTARFAQDADWRFPDEAVERRIEIALGSRRRFVDAHQAATEAFGDAAFANAVLLGCAWQFGLVPLHRESLLVAIDETGVAPALNRAAFALGRRLAAAQEAADPASGTAPVDPTPDHAERLRLYQSAAYAERHTRFVEETARAAAGWGPRAPELVKAVAEGMYRLMAYKDEYEVARLYSDGRFRQALHAAFEGPVRVQFHFSLPGRHGNRRKTTLGPWMAWPLRLLAGCRRLRGTALDPFALQAERRAERALIGWYRDAIHQMLRHAGAADIGRCLELARLPMSIRGFGHVKAAAAARARDRASVLLAELAPRPVAMPAPGSRPPTARSARAGADRQDALGVPTT